MAEKSTSLILKILRAVWIIIKSVFLGYAVIFSIVATALLVGAFLFVSKPLNEVKHLKKNNPAETAFMAQYRTHLLEQGENDSLIHRFVPLDSIAPMLKKCVLAAEDDGFYTHPGFDLNAIIDAIDHNRSQNATIRGASTITQQMAKNLFLSAERTYERKFWEFGYTLLMERYLGKERILELYLNYAQWGKNIFGCEAASIHYFRKPSSRLTLNESARLAAVLAMPSRLSPHYTQSTFMARRISVIANNLHLRGSISPAQYKELTGSYPPGMEPAPGPVESYE